MTTHGPRFHGGYQFPATNAASIRPDGPPLEFARRGPHELAVYKMTGGRPDLFQVTVQTNMGGRSASLAALVLGADHAREAFRATLALVDSGQEPESIPLPPGAQMA